MNNYRICSVEDASRILSVTEQRVRTLCREGYIASYKDGKNWHINYDSLTNYGVKTGRILAENRSQYNYSNLEKHTKKPVALSFFSGALGLDLGIEKAGFEILLTCEIDKYCRQTILLNKPETALIGDISSYRADDILRYAGLSKKTEVDLIFGGPPCQAFSTAGKRKGFHDERGNSFITYLKLALDIRPKYIVIENVRGLLSTSLKSSEYVLCDKDLSKSHLYQLPGGALYFILEMIESNGYAYSFDLYNSANFGTPQIRERIILICSRNGEKPPYLVPTHAENGNFGLKKWTTLKQAIQGIKSHNHLNFPEKRKKYYRLLKEGQNWRSLPNELQKEALGKSYLLGGGKTGFFRRLAWDRPAPTLVTQPTMPATDLAHPEELRPLSIEEYKRIQEFPDTWQLFGPLTEQYRQIGNAVPVSLGYAIGTLIYKLLHNEKIENNILNFKHSRYKNTNDLEWYFNFKKSLKGSEFSKIEQLKFSFD